MKTKIEITGIIPVKENSERVKKKNLRKFANTNLFALKLKQLKKTQCFKKFLISSESEKVLNIAKKLDFEVHKRDPYYSTSHVPMSEVYSYISSAVKTEHVAWINVTNPLVGPKIYDKAAKLYAKTLKKYDCLLSAKENRENFFFKDKPVNFKPFPWPRSQDLKPLISLPFAFSFLKKDNLKNWGSCVGKKPYFYILDDISSIDIDNTLQFKFAEFLYKKLK